jgi:hypothetical protein
MVTTAKIKFHGNGGRWEQMYQGEMSFEKVCEVINKMIERNKVVKNADSTTLRHIEKKRANHFISRGCIYHIVLDDCNLAQIMVNELK